MLQLTGEKKGTTCITQHINPDASQKNKQGDFQKGYKYAATPKLKIPFSSISFNPKYNYTC